MTRTQYRKRVWELTNKHHPYKPGWTREHHVPISFGYKHGIPPELIGGPQNVTYRKAGPNLTKGTRTDAKGRANLERWGQSHLIKPFMEYSL